MKHEYNVEIALSESANYKSPAAPPSRETPWHDMSCNNHERFVTSGLCSIKAWCINWPATESGLHPHSVAIRLLQLAAVWTPIEAVLNCSACRIAFPELFWKPTDDVLPDRHCNSNIGCQLRVESNSKSHCSFQGTINIYAIVSIFTTNIETIINNSLYSSRAPQLTVARVKTEFVTRTFRAVAPYIWNGLQVDGKWS